MSHHFGITAFGRRMVFVADCETTLRALDRYLFPWLPRDVETRQPDVVIRVLRGEAGYQARAGDRIVAYADQLENLIPLLQSYLDELVVRELSGLVAVHAGVVAIHESAILLPGPSGAGKSTLVAELVRRGCVYFSDEYALLDSRGLVHPYPRALMIRNGSIEARPVLASEWNATVGCGPVRIGLVLLLQHLAGATWNVRRLPQSETLLALLENTPHSMSESRELIQPLLRVAESAACFTGTRNDAVDAAGKILDLPAAGKP